MIPFSSVLDLSLSNSWVTKPLSFLINVSGLLTLSFTSFNRFPSLSKYWVRVKSSTSNTGGVSVPFEVTGLPIRFTGCTFSLIIVLPSGCKTPSSPLLSIISLPSGRFGSSINL